MHRPEIHPSRWFGRIAISATVVSLAVFSAAGAASAATKSAGPAAPHSTSTVVTAKLALDCTHMTAQVHQYAVAHGYCAAVGSTGTATPNSRGTANGTCGDSWIQIDNLAHGNARFTWGFDSLDGAVAYRGLAVSYLNELFGNYGGWNDGSVMLSSSYSSKPRNVGTGQGNVFGDVSGYVVLWWGGSCDLLSPSTTQKIT